MKVSDLIGGDLDYWVAKAEGLSPWMRDGVCMYWTQQCKDDAGDDGPRFFQPSCRWDDAGPIIESARIGLFQSAEWTRNIDKSNGIPFTITTQPPEVLEWAAAVDGAPDYGAGFPGSYYGPTPLIAAMRAYVAERFGDTVPELNDECIAQGGVVLI